jgi:hypothetical protein
MTIDHFTQHFQWVGFRVLAQIVQIHVHHDLRLVISIKLNGEESRFGLGGYVRVVKSELRPRNDINKCQHSLFGTSQVFQCFSTSKP